MTVTRVVQFQLYWTFVLAAALFRGIQRRDLQRIRSYFRQRYKLDEPQWVDPHQRPKRMLPGLRSIPVHPPETFPWVVELEKAYEAILQEYRGLENDVLHPHPQNLTDKGRWNVAYLYNMAKLDKVNADRCPRTMSALAKFPGAGIAGQAYFSIMTPGTHVRPHCGPTNKRIRCHLGLTEARDCWIRVGDQKLRWTPGRCIVFDDSFEHEVWHDGDTPRAVLIVDFWHPDLTEAERWALSLMRGRSRSATKYRRRTKALQTFSNLRRREIQQ